MKVSISTLSTAYGLTPEALRYYEEKGLLSPERSSSSGFRRFSIADVQMLGIIKSLQRQGFSLDEIRQVVKTGVTLPELIGMMDEKRSGLVPFDLHIHDLDFMVYAFGMPKVAYQYRSKLPNQDFISLSYDFGDFSINTEASWYATCYPFTAEFRFQFEDALVANENGKMVIFLRDPQTPKSHEPDINNIFTSSLLYNKYID